jgi:hypothetical protein
MNETGNMDGSCAVVVPPCHTLGDLIEAYQTDPASGYHKQRFEVRGNHARILRRLKAQLGAVALSDIRHRNVQIWYDGWSAGDKIAMAHAFIAQMRTMFSFGMTMVESEQCERLCVVMSKFKAKHSDPRVDSLTADQANAIRRAAREHFGWYSLALAQAFQFELVLRQRDVIGQWVPESEPGEAIVTWQGQKWQRGITWAEIDDNRILRHRTSKRQKFIEADLKLCPMIVEELSHLVYRSADGPVIINDVTGMPWSANEFRRKWRIVADFAGIPKNVRNMDSRSGGITESFAAGARPDAIQLSATHSDLSMTQKYNRQNHLQTRSEAQLLRLEHRNRTAGE